MTTYKRKVAAVLFFCAVLAAPILSSAQDEKEELEVGRWYHNVETGINLTQSAYSDNWNGGGNSALSWTAYFLGLMQKRHQNNINWATSLQLRFGQTHNKRDRGDGTSGWDQPEKTEDKIDLETLAIYEGGWEVEPYASARWQSFFVDQNDPFGRDIFINPNSFKESLGAARHIMGGGEDEFMLARLGGTARQNFRRSFADDSTDAKTGSSAYDGGAEFQLDWRVVVFDKKLAWRGKIDVYQPFWWSKADVFDEVSADSLAAVGLDTDIKDFTTVVDASWENTFITEITSWMAFNFYVIWVYDKYDNSVVPVVENGQITNADQVSQAVRKSTQWKQSFGIGVTFKFKS